MVGSTLNAWQNVIQLGLTLAILQFAACAPQINEATEGVGSRAKEDAQKKELKTTFPQIHSNLGGMVPEFVRMMFQDSKGHYWFGTNAVGIIRYNGEVLEKMPIGDGNSNVRVLNILEDTSGNLWFGTSDGLLKYDGEGFTRFGEEEGLVGYDVEIWALTIDRGGRFWVGTIDGVHHFDGERFTPFHLPASKVKDPEPILANERVDGFLEGNDGSMWISNDGNGIFQYKNGHFTQWTTEEGLVDNHSRAALLDAKGAIWISSYYGGASHFDGSSFVHFTQEGVIEGLEVSGFIEDSKGNVWFTAENVGIYKYDGAAFTLYTTEDGLTSNLVLHIFEDKKGQIWCTSWQGLCIFNGERFVNANEIEAWTN